MTPAPSSQIARHTAGSRADSRVCQPALGINACAVARPNAGLQVLMFDAPMPYVCVAAGHLSGLALSGLRYTGRGFAAQQLIEEWNARRALSAKVSSWFITNSSGRISWELYGACKTFSIASGPSPNYRKFP